LTADDCFQLGKVAYDNEDYYHAIKWFDQALLTDDMETNKMSCRSVILDYLSFSVFKVRVIFYLYFFSISVLLSCCERSWMAAHVSFTYTLNGLFCTLF